MESQRCIAVEGDAGGDSATMKINHLGLCSNTRLNCLNTLSWAEAFPKTSLVHELQVTALHM